MKTPQRLQPLIEAGLVDIGVRQLMSGKEAMVNVVCCGGETRRAKVYKEARQRSLPQAVHDTENRKNPQIKMRLIKASSRSQSSKARGR